MTNNTQMVSVPRELLLRLLAVYSPSPWPAWAELAAVLEAAPAEDVRAVVEEPVAYANPKAFENFNRFAHLGGPYSHEWMWARPAEGLVPLYRRPQRPDVLPERFDIPHRDEYESADHYAAAVHEANTWNACLDAVDELNK